MKRIVSIVLLLTLCLSLFAGCKKDTPDDTAAGSSLKDAVAYLKGMYQTAGKDEVMELFSDKDMLAAVTVEGTSFQVEWSVTVTEGAADAVKVGESSKTNHVLLDIPERAESDIKFTATATVKDADGNSESISFTYMVKGSAFGGMTDEEIVEQAYALEQGATMESAATLTGVITRIKSPYSADYQNITVVIQIGELEDKKIECYRMKGDGIENLCLGDTITVTGILKNYNGTIEFDAGCICDSVVAGERLTAPEDPAEIVAAAYALEAGKTLPYSATLTGKVIEIDSPYSEQYGNISVIIQIGEDTEHPILCYRIKGTGADVLAVGDEITVVGYIVNYNGTIEFESGSQLTALVPGDGSSVEDPTEDVEDPTEDVEDPTEETEKPTEPSVKVETDPAKIMAAAEKLAENEELSYEVTLSGKVTAINDVYSEEFQNITVTITVTGANKSLKVYRLKGDGVDQIAVNDTITVKGTIKNYYGEIELVNGQMTARKSGGGTVVTQETDPAKIMAAAEKLGENEEMSYDVTLSGKVTAVNDLYSAEYQNITVTITVTGANKSLKVYRLKGDGVDKIAVNDTITVKGRIKNFYGEIELVNGQMTARTSGGGSVTTQETDPQKIVDAAYNLGANEELSYDATLTGKVTNINTAYSADYQNITVTIEVSGRESKPIVCFRLKGDGVDKIVVGDTITVTGRLKNYVPEGKDTGTVEFDAGCTMDKRVSGGVTVPTDPKEIVAQAYALEAGKSLPYTCTLTGTVTEIDTEYSAQYKNVTVIIVVEGCEDKPITCFRMKGDGADTVKVGDTISVTGIIKNYQHSSGDCEIEFDSGCTFVFA